MIRQELFIGKVLSEDDPVFQLKPYCQPLLSPRAQLTVVRGAQNGEVFLMASKVNLFGRTDGRILRDVMASRRHMQISADDSSYILSDLASKNGTFLNGERVTQSIALNHGDIIRVGETLLVFEIPGNEPAVLGYGAAPQRFSDSSYREATIPTRSGS